MVNILGFTGIGVSEIALIFVMLTVAQTHWQTHAAVPITTFIRLLDYCIGIGGNQDHSDRNSNSDEASGEYRIAQVMIILGLVSVLGFTVAALLLYIHVIKSIKNVVFFVAGGIDILAVLAQTQAVGSTNTTVGLWNYCFGNGGNKEFKDIKSDNVNNFGLSIDYIAVIILGVMAATGVIVAAFLVMFVTKNTKSLLYVAAIFGITYGSFMFFGFATLLKASIHDMSFVTACVWIAGVFGVEYFIAAKIDEFFFKRHEPPDRSLVLHV